MDLHGLVRCSLLVLLELVLLAGKVLPDDLHRERSSADFEHWTRAEVAEEHLRVDNGRGDDDSKVRSPRQASLDHGQQEVGEVTPLVGLVHHHTGEGFQVRVCEALVEQGVVRHVDDFR